MTEFKLEDDDCAIILKEDGSTEIILPKYENKEDEVTDNMILAVGIVTLIPKPEFQKLLSTTMDEVINTMDEEE